MISFDPSPPRIESQRSAPNLQLQFHTFHLLFSLHLCGATRPWNHPATALHAHPRDGDLSRSLELSGALLGLSQGPWPFWPFFWMEIAKCMCKLLYLRWYSDILWCCLHTAQFWNSLWKQAELHERDRTKWNNSAMHAFLSDKFYKHSYDSTCNWLWVSLLKRALWGLVLWLNWFEGKWGKNMIVNQHKPALLHCQWTQLIMGLQRFPFSRVLQTPSGFDGKKHHEKHLQKHADRHLNDGSSCCCLLHFMDLEWFGWTWHFDIFWIEHDLVIRTAFHGETHRPVVLPPWGFAPGTAWEVQAREWKCNLDGMARNSSLKWLPEGSPVLDTPHHLQSIL